MRNRLGVSLIVIAAAAFPGGGTAAQAPVASIKPDVDKLFSSRWTTSTPGCAVGADVKGQPVVRAAYGMADLEHDVPNTPETIFEVGSVSKQFTAAAVLLLARDGKLSLDDKVRKHIPEMPDVAADITIRQMLNHTAGLRDWGSLASIAGWPRTTRVHTHAHVLDIVSRQRMLNFEPGTRWSYSNTGYNLAAILVSRVSGMSFADFTRTRLFEPLGMKDTSWRDDYTRIVKRRAIAYGEQKAVFSTLMPFENVHGNGGLLTTVGDLMKWNANFVNPVVGDARFVADMERRTKFNDGREHEYALGLYVDTYRGRREVDHSGGTAGYVAHLSRYPDHGVSVAVICNVTSGNATNNAKAIADLLLPPGRAADSPASEPLNAEEGPRYAGLYRSLKPAGVVTISVQKDRLVSSTFGALTRVARHRFDAGGAYVLEFDGRFLRVTDEFGTADDYERVEPWKPGVQELKPIAGRYVSDELELTVNLALDGDRLVVNRGPAGTLQLNPVFPDGFQSGAGWVVVRRDGSGRVTGFSVNQDRVWDLRFDRLP
ncbi:MAG: serine hydrolase domain-containing protein [Vicinamibacterales bacterium]